MIENRAKDVQMVPIESIIPNSKNRNIHTAEQIARLKEIIEYQGFRVPVIISNRTGRLVAGHGRLLAAKELGLKEIPASFQDFDSDEQEYAAGVSDNSIALWAELDLSGINTDLAELDGTSFDINMLGIEDFVLEPADKFTEDADAVPETPKVAKSKRGELWLLGEHRLLCGDATSREDLERLMAGEKANLLLTDPPYGVSYADKNAFLNSISRGNRIQKRIENDHQTPEEMAELWFRFLSTAIDFTSDKCAYYICSPQGGELMMMMMMSIPRAGWQLKHMLIWVKNVHVLGRADYNYRHEPILYGWKEKGTHEFYGGGGETTVWEFNKPHKNDLHPTMKPVELLEKAIHNSSKQEEIVYDPFSGSGSTLIACEKTGRRCFGMEIEPLYIDVILERWAKFTGNDPVREDGLRWSQLNGIG